MDQFSGEYELSSFSNCHSSELITRLILLNDGNLITETTNLNTAKKNSTNEACVDDYGFPVGYLSQELSTLSVPEILDKRNDQKYAIKRYLFDPVLGYFVLVGDDNKVDELSPVSSDQNIITYKGNQYKKVG